MTCFKYSLLHFISIYDFNLDFKFISDRIDIDLDSLPQPTNKTLDFKFIFMSLLYELKRVLKILDFKEQKVVKLYYGLFGGNSLMTSLI